MGTLLLGSCALLMLLLMLYILCCYPCDLFTLIREDNSSEDPDFNIYQALEEDQRCDQDDHDVGSNTADSAD